MSKSNASVVMFKYAEAVVVVVTSGRGAPVTRQSMEK